MDIISEAIVTQISDQNNPNNYDLTLEDVSIGYKNKKVLSDLSLSLERGSTYAIVGPSGVGKTTLFKSIIGLLKPTAGKITLLGNDIYSKEQKNLNRGRVGYIPQNLGLVRSLDVRTNILLGSLGRVGTLSSLVGMFSHKDHKFTEKIIEQLGIADKADINVQQLSGGEKRRVAIARALLQQPEILIADEFLSELDFRTAENVMNIVLNNQEDTDMTILLIEHNLEMALKYADKVIVVKSGEIAGVLDTKDIQAENKLRGLFHDN